MSSIRKIDISKLCPGQHLASDLYNRDGTLLVRAGSKVTDDLLRQIDALQLNEVDIFDQLAEDNMPSNRRSPLSDKDKDAVRDYFNAALNSKTPYETVHYSKMASEVLVDAIPNSYVEICIEDLRMTSEYTYNHSVDVAGIAITIGRGLNISQERLVDLGISGLLHDIGKSKIPLSILEKPGKLTDEEFAVMKSHPLLGYEMLKNNEYLTNEILCGVLQHHEKQDGTGYPFGLTGDRISEFGKIIAVADVFDALVTKRSYHAAFPASDAIKLMMESPNHFDSRALNAFLETITVYPLGSNVCLSNGEVATVIANHKTAVLRPLVQGLSDGKFYDLQNDYNCASINIL